jgi:hypothetical protein
LIFLEVDLNLVKGGPKNQLSIELEVVDTGKVEIP